MVIVNANSPRLRSPSPAPPGEADQEDALQRDISAFQRLIDQATANGYLARQDEEVILAALVRGEANRSAKCALFRQLQERVWRAELYLDP